MPTPPPGPSGDAPAVTTTATATPADHRAARALQPSTSPGTRIDTDTVARALDRAVDALFTKQRADGHWCAELEGDSILSSEYLLMKAILGQRSPDDAEGSPADTPEKFEKICAYLRALQRTGGAWGQYPGSGPDVSATAKAYLALKIFGDDPKSPHMRAALEATHRLGGAEKINTFSMFYLACLGQVSWKACPTIPPEVVFLPRWFPFHMDKVAAWTRTMILPLALCTALRPVRTLPDHLGCAELFIDPKSRTRLNKPWNTKDPTCWSNIFLGIDRFLKFVHAARLSPVRSASIRAARDWIVERMRADTTDGLGAIFPPMVYIQVALHKMGYERSHPVRAEAERQLDRFIVEKDDHIRIQPCFSPVWDTGIALYALTEAGLTAQDDDRIARTCAWLCDREVKLVGDWVRNLRAADRERFRADRDSWAAWAFEYRNDWYPDVDDTAMVAKAMRRAADGLPPGHRFADTARRATEWIVAMQNDDGGWAAFDRTKHREWMEAVPFADHNAMQDPSCPDITGRTIEALITCGVPRDHASVRRAVEYLKTTQLPEGCWKGRWGVNYLYGTWQAVGGLDAAGEDVRQPYLQRTLTWLRKVQNEDGGFGESANSYENESIKGVGPSTASQTAWGVTTLMYLTSPNDTAVLRAIRWLVDHQLDADTPAAPWPVQVEGEDWKLGLIEQSEKTAPKANHLVDEPAGAWREPWFTGTGFPKVFYLRYHLYRHYFPVMALGRWVRLTGVRPTHSGNQV
ncbi:MAG: squalene--hopene cyclase [Phycisphaeraceae bacterium]|nr:MAG: squalene--hopene cyclase [Phycisphaeraceae bacterium]